MSGAWFGLAVLLAGALTGCGARTGLDVDVLTGTGSGTGGGSTCSALVLASDVADPGYVALDATGVYWIASPALPAPSTILRCDQAGCGGNPTVLASLGEQGGWLAVDDTRLWWVDPDGNIQSCVKQACAPQPFAKGASLTGLLLDLDNVYFDTDDALVSCPKTGCAAPTTIVSAPPPGSPPGPSAVDATQVYFGDASMSAQLAIRACALPVCAGGPTTLVDGLSDVPLSFAVDDTQIYFSFSGDVGVNNGAVFACAKSGCGSTPTTLATGLDFPNNLVASGGRLYWTTGSNTGQTVGDGQVMACATSGCGGSPEVLAANQPNPNSLAVDGGCVYWSNAGLGFDLVNGSVQRVPK